MKKSAIYIIILLFQTSTYAQSTDSLLKLLDQTIEQRLEYDKKRKPRFSV